MNSFKLNGPIINWVTTYIAKVITYKAIIDFKRKKDVFLIETKDSVYELKITKIE